MASAFSNPSRSGLKNTGGSGSCGRFPWERRPAAIHYLIAPRWRSHGGRFKANQLFETPSSVFCRHTFATPLQKNGTLVPIVSPNSHYR